MKAWNNVELGLCQRCKKSRYVNECSDCKECHDRAYNEPPDHRYARAFSPSRSLLGRFRAARTRRQIRKGKV